MAYICSLGSVRLSLTGVFWWRFVHVLVVFHLEQNGIDDNVVILTETKIPGDGQCNAANSELLDRSARCKCMSNL